MHLAYIDDSGSDAQNSIVIVGAVIVHDRDFWRIDSNVGAIAEAMLPPDRLGEFEEFKAAELFGGYGFFHGVPEADRHNLIWALLSTVAKRKIPFIYAAVDKKALAGSVFSSSNPVDVAFQVCACGVGDWMNDRYRRAVKALPDQGQFSTEVGKELIENPFMLIADDTDDKKLKETLRKSFRSLRPRSHDMKYPLIAPLEMCHDDMFFGDSKSSIGLQLVDVCAHIMLRRLRDGIQDRFFDKVAPHARSARPEPFWSQCAHIMRMHDAVPDVSEIFGVAEPSEPKEPAEDQQ